MFIVAFNKKVEEKLINSGFKLLNRNDGRATFIYNKSIKFNFDNLDKSTFLLTNKLNF